MSTRRNFNTNRNEGVIGNDRGQEVRNTSYNPLNDYMRRNNDTSNTRPQTDNSLLRELQGFDWGGVIEQTDAKIAASSERFKNERAYYATKHFSRKILLSSDVRQAIGKGISNTNNPDRSDHWQTIKTAVIDMSHHRAGSPELASQIPTAAMRNLESAARALMEGCSSLRVPQVARLIVDEFNRIHKEYEKDTTYAIDNMGVNIFTGKQ